MRIETFEQLESFLKNFTSWQDKETYDFGGNFALFLACIDSLKRNALKVELEDVKEYMSEEQQLFILELANYIKT